LGCVEVTALRKLALTPPHIRKDMNYKAHAGQLRAALNGIWWEYSGLGAVLSAVAAYMLAGCGAIEAAALLPLALYIDLARRKHGYLFNRLKQEICQPNTQESSLCDIAYAVLSALRELKIVPRSATNEMIQVSRRADGSFRVFLDQVEP